MTLRMIARVQVEMLACAYDPTRKARFLRLERVETYLINRVNRD